jgi:hypothetical protein
MHRRRRVKTSVITLQHDPYTGEAFYAWSEWSYTWFGWQWRWQSRVVPSSARLGQLL